MIDHPIEIRVPLGGGIDAVLKVTEGVLVQNSGGEGGCAASGTVVVFADVEKPPPRKRVSSLQMQVPVKDQVRDAVELLRLTLDVELDYPGSAS